jgi:hypothetical protein
MLTDQYTDKSFRVLHSKLSSFPSEVKDLIKTAEINYTEVQELPTTSFAWPEMRKYALHTKEHAVLSKIYSTGEEIPSRVKESIDKALDLYDVKVPQEEKVASENTSPENIQDYLIPHMQLGKMEDASTVKEASRFFTNNFKKMNMETRVNAAVNLVKKASQHNVKVPSKIYKHAGLTCTNRKVLNEWLEARQLASKHAEASKSYEKLASYVGNKNNDLSSRADLLKIADAIYTLDKKAELVKHYDRSLPDPVLTVFNTVKLAEETVSLAGKDVSVTKLMGLSKENYADALGDDIVPEITDTDGNLEQDSLVDLLKTLPADMQMSLVKNLGL